MVLGAIHMLRLRVYYVLSFAKDFLRCNLVLEKLIGLVVVNHAIASRSF